MNPTAPESTGSTAPLVEVRQRGGEAEETRREILADLLEPPRSIPSRFFYDDQGSQLFEQICTLPEYYQTRTERALLANHAAEITELAGATQLVELGAGSAVKTRLLLDALWRTGRLIRFVPLDVSEEMLRRTADDVAGAYPGLQVHAVVADFMHHVAPLPPSEGRRLAIFLGGTIGNLHPQHQAPAFLEQLAAALNPGDTFLLGVDRIKDVTTLEAAYNDREGVTAAFNRNILRVVNRLLDANFQPRSFAHRAFYDSENDWIEMRLVAQGDQTVRLGRAAMVLRLHDGEEIRTEISAKYDDARVERLLNGTGLRQLSTYSDARQLFSLYLCRKEA